MDQHDRDNLRFLLGLDTQALWRWYNSATEDDIAYAQEILDAYGQELDQLSLIQEHGFVHSAPQQLQ